MKIAVPLAGGRLCAHFGHCEAFALMEVDATGKTILNSTSLNAPPHQPGLLPVWLAERGVSLIIAGGMGRRAQDLFEAQGIQTLVGAPSGTAQELVSAFLNGSLVPGDNACDH